MKGNRWTPEQDALLADLWGRGKSASECADSLPGKTRNSVIGRAHRLKLDHGTARSGPRPSFSPGESLARHNEARRARRSAARVEQAPPDRFRAAPVATKAEEPPTGAGVRFRELEPYHCKWPLNSKCEEGIWKSCGEPRKEASPYCPHHHSRAFAGLRYAPRVHKPKENGRQFNG